LLQCFDSDNEFGEQPGLQRIFLPELDIIVDDVGDLDLIRNDTITEPEIHVPELRNTPICAHCIRGHGIGSLLPVASIR
jgi:hypothetical protein